MSNTTDLKEIVRDIERNNILLPDFQREFAWKDEDVQINIICSILAKMPVGSILLLESKANEYLCKILGTTRTLDTEQIKDKEVQFLLDGQQRLTVLANVFSNTIFNQCNKISELISPSLKRRFFLRIPFWKNTDKEKDIFGLRKLIFPLDNPDSDDPDFLTGDIKPFIECIPFLEKDDVPYKPKTPLSTDLDNFCLNYKTKDVTGYLIPLFLLAPSDIQNKKQIDLRYNAILDGISLNIKNEILLAYSEIVDEQEKREFLQNFWPQEVTESIIKDETVLKQELIESVKWWRDNLQKYLDASIKNVMLNKIIVSEKQRARAIDIYENLNRGGVSLNTFDLIMAKVAKKDNNNFYKRLRDNILSNKKDYKSDLIPNSLSKIISPRLAKKSYNASKEIGSYNENKNEISSKYIDAFLNILSLYSYNTNLDPLKIKIDYIKRDKILDLSPDSIHENCERVCTALDRTFFFLQTRCGIRKINEVNYALILTVIGTIFTNDKWFNNPEVHNKLEAWYWSILFSGEYDKDQNTTAIKHLAQFITMFSKKTWDVTWIKNITKLVFAGQNFSDRDLLLMNKVNDDRYPKNIIKLFICQYFLAKTYPDMFDSNIQISVFYKDSDSLEAHHIVPLGSIKKIGENTGSLRDNPSHICNSPINFVLITKASNLEILEDDLSTYSKKITNQAKTRLFIQTDYGTADSTKDEYIKQFMGNRFDAIQGDVVNHINELLQ